ncbi:hypothetical protein [Arthrobacter sunyaminii]|uniref:hypothetical protein n=1 Tax=Arthrobacter sunyaminii TaxID=2816859 RepID=UPI001A93D000|nr:hypothetical protein [Arthrobacter sunyaminii]MBO0897508.1 hypothetical protein [Arthrobacter sunyaminii]
MNQPPVENDARTATETPAPSEIHSAGEDNARTAVLGPFGLRDTVVGGSVLLMLIGSLLPWSFAFGLEATFWSPLTPLFFLGIGIILPLLVAGLFAARRMAPELKYRVGSLSVDQFGSVVAVLAVAFFFLQVVNDFTIGALVTLIGALGLVASTTLAPHIPPFSREFDERPAAPAHVMARDAVRLRRRPAKPAPQGATAAGAENGTGENAGNSAVPAESRFAGMGKGMGKLAPTGLFGRKANDGVTPGADAPAVNGIPADAAEAGSGAGRTEPARTEAVPADSARTESTADQNAASQGSASTQAPAASQVPASNQAPAAAPDSEDALAATTVNPVVPAKSAEAEPATQASAQVPSSGNESISATREESENVVEAFWFAVGTPRQIVDERTGLPLFMFHPGDWELGLEDRGTEFLVQDKRTGRIGVLRDLSNIERVGEDSGE